MKGKEINAGMPLFYEQIKSLLPTIKRAFINERKYKAKVRKGGKGIRSYVLFI